MSNAWKTRLIKYGGSAAFVAALAYVYLSSREWDGISLMDRYRFLCDALTIPGVLLLMFGCLIWCANMGALDAISYAVGTCIRSLIPGARLGIDEKYADYVERKKQNRVHGYGFLFIAGGVTMAVAMVFFALYYSV